jgi:hypothetical protein
MKRIITILAFLLSAASTFGQGTQSQRIIFTSANPPTVCAPGKLYSNATTHKVYQGSATSTCTQIDASAASGATDATYITETANSGLSNEFALGTLPTGPLANTTTTGVPRAATATDMSTPLFCSDAGANDTYACNLAPVPAAYVVGTHLRFRANTANTGAATVNFNTLGALTIVKVAGGITTALADNDIRAGQWVDGVIATGSNFQIQSTLGNAPASGITNSAGANVVPKSDGTNLVASHISDNSEVIIRDNGDLQSANFNTRQLMLDDGAGGPGTAAIDWSGDHISVLGGDIMFLPEGIIDGIKIILNGGISIDSSEGAILAGTATNSNAPAGFIGEFLTASLASGSATSLSTGTAKTITSVSLTAGDWDVYGIVDYIPAATTTTSFVQQGASSTDNTLGGEGTFTSSSGGNLSGTVLGSLLAENIPYQRISLAATTTIYLVGKASFAISTMTAYGTISARRAR